MQRYAEGRAPSGGCVSSLVKTRLLKASLKTGLKNRENPTPPCGRTEGGSTTPTRGTPASARRSGAFTPEILELRGNSSAQSLRSYSQSSRPLSSRRFVIGPHFSSPRPVAPGDEKCGLLVFFGVVRPIPTSIIRFFAFGLESKAVSGRLGRPGDPPLARRTAAAARRSASPRYFFWNTSETSFSETEPVDSLKRLSR